MPLVKDRRTTDRRPIESLNGLRFVAAMLVVVYHYFWLGSVQDADGLAADPRGPLSAWLGRWLPMLSDAHLAVDFFAILSGFVLAYAHWDSITDGRFQFAKFLKRRFARVYPLHLATLIVCILLAVAAAALGVQTRGGDSFAPSAILPNLLLLQSFGVTSGLTFNGPSWFVSAAFFTYMLFPIFVILFARSRMPSLGKLIAAVATFLAVYFSLPGEHVLTHRTFDIGAMRVALEFPIGIALFLVLREYEASDSAWVRPWHVAAIGAALAVLAQLQVTEAAIVVLLAALIFACAAAELRHGLAWLTGRQLLYGGDISFAMYMIQMPLYAIVLKACTVTGLISRGTLGSDLAALSCAFLTIPIAMLVERFFERPAHDWTLRALSRPPQPAASATS